ncbi:LacI family DNA-binding transcriptional regulator [Reyranella sp.]|uniref:LacI family DNA-binding transcriptional regulator n=1 Tax=Reyranella sp. TaxID=1929291 RepID=UPI003BA8AA13
MEEIVSRNASVTIREVAQAAGVSLSTVSRALNGGKNVSARVARDVAAAANRLGYQPDILARSLRTRTTGMVGCLVSDISNPLYAGIVQAAERRLSEAGYLLVVASTANDPGRERAAVAEFAGRRLDGVLVAPGNAANDRTWHALAAAGTSVVILDRDSPPIDAGETPWPAVLVDHREGARAATRYLVGLGHRRIALLTPGGGMRPGRERIAGFRDALAEAGIDPAAAPVCIQESSMDFAQGDALALLGGAERPTALIALGTRILAGALRAARDLGLSVPGDLSVLSVGDTDLAAMHTPAITALRWNLEEVGRAAAELLLQRLRGGGPVQSRALLPVDLVLRQSCAPPPVGLV